MKLKAFPIVMTALVTMALVLSFLFALPSFAGETAREPEPPGCFTDANCPQGQVCEPTDANCSVNSRQCVPGCRVGSRTCGSGKTCVPGPMCVTCPCPDTCEYIGIGPGGDDPTFRVIDASNPANPHDDAGRLHNAGLDEVIQLRDDFDGEIRAFALASLQRLREFSCAAGGEEPCYGRLPGLRVAKSLAQPEQFQAEIAAALAEDQRPYFESLLTTVREGSVGVEEKLDQLRNLEAEMQLTLSKEQAEPLLKAASVARHSLVYWQGQADGESAWNLDPSRVDDASFDVVTTKLAAYDLAGGFVPYPPYYDPVQGTMASVWAIVMMILDLFF